MPTATTAGGAGTAGSEPASAELELQFPGGRRRTGWAGPTTETDGYRVTIKGDEGADSGVGGDAGTGDAGQQVGTVEPLDRSGRF